MCVWLTNPSIVSVFKHASQVQPGQKEKDASEKERRTTLFYFPHDTKKPNLLKNLTLFFFVESSCMFLKMSLIFFNDVL